jgi:hypothetical protein
MKKILILILASIALAQTAKAQGFPNNYRPKIGDMNNKKVRGAKEQCIEDFRYTDTSALGSGTLILVRHTKYSYTGNRGSNGLKKQYNFYPDLNAYIPDFDRAVSDIDVQSNADSVITLYSFDAQDRIIKKVFISFNGTFIDTSTVTLYKYTATNTVADSIIELMPLAGATPISITANKVSLNRIDSTTQIMNMGSGQTFTSSTEYLYDANGNIKEQTLMIDIFGTVYYLRSTYLYLSNNLLDSITVLEGPDLVSLAKSSTVGFNYNANFTSGKWINKDFAGVTDQFANFKLDASGNMLESTVYSVDGIDTLKSDSTIYSYTPHNNLNFHKQYNSDIDGLYWKAYDSVRYIYKPIFATAINTTAAIQGLSVLPTKVTTNAYVHYQTTQMQKATLTITNMSGVVLHQQNLSALNGNTIVPVDASNFANGMYNATIVTEDGSKASIRFVK